MSISEKPVILVVEDDFVDFEMIKRGVAQRKLDVGLVNAIDGNEALNMLRSDQITQTQRDKMVILLDINMPGMNGHQFLDELRGDEHLRSSLVFMLTTSDHPRDISRAFERNVAGYFLKSDLNGLLDTLSTYFEKSQFPHIPTLSII